MKKHNALSILLYVLFVFIYSDIVVATQPAYLADLPSGFGPYDYTDPIAWKNLNVVEKYHFDDGVRSFRRGLNGSVWGDINYTLRAFPNHHLALEAMVRLLRQKDSYMTYQKRKILYSRMPKEVNAEAYFKKAIKFSPGDSKTVFLYGIHLHKTKKYKEALKQYKVAESLGLVSADLSYNFGLLYLKLGSPEKAFKYAKKAYAQGHPLPALREKLIKMNVWE